DGRIVIGGLFTNVNSINRNFLARLAYDGSIDSTFNPGAGPDAPVFATAETFVNTDRKLLIAGNFNTVNSTPRPYVARLNDDGSVDGNFNPSPGPNGQIFALAVQSNGKVLIGGDFPSVNGVARNHVARLNTDGSLDLSFDPIAGANDSIRALAIQSDGR